MFHIFHLIDYRVCLSFPLFIVNLSFQLYIYFFIIFRDLHITLSNVNIVVNNEKTNLQFWDIEKSRYTYILTSNNSFTIQLMNQLDYYSHRKDHLALYLSVIHDPYFDY